MAPVNAPFRESRMNVLAGILIGWFIGGWSVRVLSVLSWGLAWCGYRWAVSAHHDHTAVMRASGRHARFGISHGTAYFIIEYATAVTTAGLLAVLTGLVTPASNSSVASSPESSVSHQSPSIVGAAPVKSALDSLALEAGIARQCDGFVGYLPDRPVLSGQQLRGGGRSGRSLLEVSNHTPFDAVIHLVNVETNRGTRIMFVASGATGIFRHLRSGIYTVRFALGTELLDSHRFCHPRGFREFDHKFHTSEIVSGEEIQYTRGRITLHPVAVGNETTSPIDSAVFYAGT